jgi:hypothetical protein
MRKRNCPAQPQRRHPLKIGLQLAVAPLQTRLNYAEFCAKTMEKAGLLYSTAVLKAAASGSLQLFSKKPLLRAGPRQR